MVLFQGEYSFRSSNAVFGIGVCGVFAGVFAWASFSAVEMDGKHFTLAIGLGFAIASTAMFVIMLKLLGSFLAGKSWNLTVTTEGIQYGNHFLGWTQIAEFYSVEYSNGICLGFRAAKQKFGFEQSLPTTPLLTASDYDALVLALREKVLPTYPDLIVVTKPRQP